MRPTQPTILLRAMGLWSMARVADGISKMADRVDVTIDLGAVTPLRLIEAAFFQSVSAEIYAPAEVVIQVSDDGVHFEQLYQQRNVVDLATDFKVQTLEWRGERKARFIRYQAKAGAQGGWIFTDEIRVE